MVEQKEKEAGGWEAMEDDDLDIERQHEGEIARPRYLPGAHPGVVDWLDGRSDIEEDHGVPTYEKESCCEDTLDKWSVLESRAKRRCRRTYSALFGWSCFKGLRQSCLACVDWVNFDGCFLGLITILIAGGICGITAVLLVAGNSPKGGLLALDEISFDLSNIGGPLHDLIFHRKRFKLELTAPTALAISDDVTRQTEASRILENMLLPQSNLVRKGDDVPEFHPNLEDAKIVVHAVMSIFVQVEDSLIPYTTASDRTVGAMITAAPMPGHLDPRCGFIDCFKTAGSSINSVVSQASTTVHSVASEASSAVTSVASDASSVATSVYSEASSKIVSVYAAATDWWNSHKLNVPDRISYYPMDSCSGSDDKDDNSKFDPEKTYCTTPVPISRIKLLDQITAVCNNLGPILGAAGTALELMSYAIMILVNFHFIGLVGGASLAAIVVVLTILFLILECCRRGQCCYESGNKPWNMNPGHGCRCCLRPSKSPEDINQQKYLTYDAQGRSRSQKWLEAYGPSYGAGDGRDDFEPDFAHEGDWEELRYTQDYDYLKWDKESRKQEEERLRRMTKKSKKKVERRMKKQAKKYVIYPGLSKMTWSISTISLWVLTYTTTFYTILIMVVYTAAFALAGLVGIKTDLGVIFLAVSWGQVMCIFVVSCFWARRNRRSIWASLWRPCGVVCWFVTLGCCFHWCRKGGLSRTWRRIKMCVACCRSCSCTQCRSCWAQCCDKYCGDWQDCCKDLKWQKPSSVDDNEFNDEKGSFSEKSREGPRETHSTWHGQDEKRRDNRRQWGGEYEPATRLTSDELAKLNVQNRAQPQRPRPTFQQPRRAEMKGSGDMDAWLEEQPDEGASGFQKPLAQPPRTYSGQPPEPWHRFQTGPGAPNILDDPPSYSPGGMSTDNDAYDSDDQAYELRRGFRSPEYPMGKVPKGPYNDFTSNRRPYAGWIDEPYDSDQTRVDADGFDGDRTRVDADGSDSDRTCVNADEFDNESLYGNERWSPEISDIEETYEQSKGQVPSNYKQNQADAWDEERNIAPERLHNLREDRRKEGKFTAEQEDEYRRMMWEEARHRGYNQRAQYVKRQEQRQASFEAGDQSEDEDEPTSKDDDDGNGGSERTR